MEGMNQVRKDARFVMSLWFLKETVVPAVNVFCEKNHVLLRQEARLWKSNSKKTSFQTLEIICLQTFGRIPKDFAQIVNVVYHVF